MEIDQLSAKVTLAKPEQDSSETTPTMKITADTVETVMQLKQLSKQLVQQLSVQ